MQDVMIEQLNDSTFDLVIDTDNEKYQEVEGLETAVNFQVFVDKRATKDDVAYPLYRAGWLADIMTKKAGYEVGSYLYFMNQSRNTQIERNEANGHVKNALRYFVKKGAAKNVTSQIDNRSISATIEVSNDITIKYNKLWRNTNAN